MINADVENPDTILPPETDVVQQASNPNPDQHRAAPIIQQQQNVPQQTTIVQPEESLQHGLANGNAGGAPPRTKVETPRMLVQPSPLAVRHASFMHRGLANTVDVALAASSITHEYANHLLKVV